MQETSKVFEKIIQLLGRAGVEYELLRHEPVRTAQEASKIRETSIKEGVKAIIFAADGKPVLICVSGDRRIDSKVFKKDYGVKDLRLLSPEEVLQLTGLEVGAIPPLGKAMNLLTYLDKAVLNNEYVCFNAGSHTRSVKMKTADFVQLATPELGYFSCYK